MGLHPRSRWRLATDFHQCFVSVALVFFSFLIQFVDLSFLWEILSGLCFPPLVYRTLCLQNVIGNPFVSETSHCRKPYAVGNFNPIGPFLITWRPMVITTIGIIIGLKEAKMVKTNNKTFQLIPFNMPSGMVTNATRPPMSNQSTNLIIYDTLNEISFFDCWIYLLIFI